MAALAHARSRIAEHPHCRLIGATEPEETAPLGPHDQPPYLNQMLAVETTLDPSTLLARLQRIEAEAGRVRSTHWGSRTLDLVIVLFNDRVVDSAALTIPHPGLAHRPFWQRELAELRDQIARAADE
jgi:2-amino-4-hydroxy-6-hydroxymethyldihydropteridine diphosphokinase